MIRRGLGVYAEYVDDTADWLLGEAGKGLAGDLRRHARTARRRDREAAGLAERLARQPAWRAADALIPKPEAEARVVRYEAHLSRQLTATLRELERLQLLRAERPGVRPAGAGSEAG